jgi:hypothetical protein
MPDVLNPTLTVKAGGHEFIFRVPSPLDKARQGSREASIRRQVDPTGSGWADGYDVETFYLIRGMAVLELFLVKSDARWVFTELPTSKDGPAGGVRVDINAFPPGKEDVISEVGREFQPALDRFHGRGPGSTEPALAKVVEGGVDTGAL